MQDKKLSELSSLLRTNLDGIDLIPVLDLNETVVNNRNKVLPVEELYQYVRRRFLAGGDVLYLLQGLNTSQIGYFNELFVNTINGNTLDGGNRINVSGDVVVYVPGGIYTDRLTGNTNAQSSIRILENGAITVSQSSTESLRLTVDKRLLIGSSNSRVIGNQYEGLLQVEGINGAASAVSIIANNSNNVGASLFLAKTRSEVVGGVTAVQNNDELGSIQFAGANGSNLSNIGASISAALDGVPFTNNDASNLPTRLTFFTASAGSGTPTERISIDSTGLLNFNADKDTGIYSSASNTLDIKAGGVRVVSATSTGVGLYGQINLYGYDPYVTILDSNVLTDNRTILFPNVSGTVVVSNSVGVVTSQMILNNTIVNEDINANADIAVSKLNRGLQNQILQTNAAGNSVTWSTNLVVPGTLNVKGISTLEGAVVAQTNVQSPSFIPNGVNVPILGMYAPQNNELGFSTNTVLRLLIDSSGQLRAGSAGTVAAPSWTFNGDPNTGIYNSAADNLSFAVGGVEALRINSTGALGFAGTDFGTAGQLLFSNGSGAVPSWRSLSGDITINTSGVVSIAAGSIVDADINVAAAIADTKLATISTINKISVSAINLTGAAELGAAIQDTDLLLAHDDSSNTRRAVLASRLTDFVFNKVSGALTITAGGVASLQSSIALNGVSTAPTASTDTNTTQIATTAFVVGQAANSFPLINGVAAVGTSLRYARADHVHASDTTKANASNASLTGIPTAPTAAVDTNTTQLATTAYVINQGYLKTATASSTFAPINSPGLTGTPTAPTADTATNTAQLATTAFVKNVVNSTFPGLVVKTACRLATTVSITLSGEQTIDGINAVSNDRILVKNQNTSSENGVYVVSTGSWSRATDFDSNGEVVSGSYFYIEDGSTNGATTWVLITTGSINVGTTSLTFSQFSSADATNAGDGLSKTGLTFNVGTASVSRIIVNPDNIDLASTGVSADTYKSVTVDTYGRVTSGTNPTTLAGFGITDAATVNQTMYIGTTQVNLNRASANLGLTGISSVVFPGSTSGTITLLAASTAGTNTLTLPAVTGTVITSADTGTITNAMIAASAVSNTNVASNAAIDFSKLAPLNSEQILIGNNSNVVTATSVSGDISINNSGVVSIVSGVIVDSDINASAAIQDTKLATLSTAGKVANSATTATSSNTANTIVLRDANGNFSAGVVTATSFSGSGSGLTNIPGAQITGTISSGVLSNSSLYIGTTQVVLNRASANQALTGISSLTLPGATSGAIVLQSAAIAGTNTLTLPATTGMVLSSGDTGSVTGTIIATNTITNTNINSSAAISLSKLENVTAGHVVLGNASNVATATLISGDISITSSGVVSIATGAIVDADVNGAAAIAGTKISPNFGSQNISTTGSVTGNNITSNAVIYATAGSTTNPSISAVGDTNTGVMWDGSNPDTLSIVCGGSRSAQFETTQTRYVKKLLITNTDDANATADNTLYDSAPLELQAKYYASSTTNNAAWRIFNDILDTSANSNLVFQYSTPAGTNTLGTLSNGGVLTVTTVSGALVGNATTASALQTARTITLSGELSGSVSFNGSQNTTLTATIGSGVVTPGKLDRQYSSLAFVYFCSSF